MSNTASLTYIFADINAALTTVAPSFFGWAELKRNRPPPYYVWCPTTDELDVGSSSAIWGSNPRGLAVAMQHVEIHCTGAKYEDAFRLRQALVTAIRAELSATVKIKTAQWGQHSDGMASWVCAQTIGFRVPIIETSLPGGGVGADIVDKVRRKVRPSSVGFDTTGEADGDGVLVVPNK